MPEVKLPSAHELTADSEQLKRFLSERDERNIRKLHEDNKFWVLKEIHDIAVSARFLLKIPKHVEVKNSIRDFDVQIDRIIESTHDVARAIGIVDKLLPENDEDVKSQDVLSAIHEMRTTLKEGNPVLAFMDELSLKKITEAIDKGTMAEVISGNYPESVVVFLQKLIFMLQERDGDNKPKVTAHRFRTIKRWVNEDITNKYNEDWIRTLNNGALENEIRKETSALQEELNRIDEEDLFTNLQAVA
jgi:hypothetical protein